MYSETWILYSLNVFSFTVSMLIFTLPKLPYEQQQIFLEYVFVLSAQLYYCTVIILNWAYSGLLMFFQYFPLEISKKRIDFQ